MFYFLWLNERGNRSADGVPHDVSRILGADPLALQKPESPLWGPMGGVHYWGEPLFGYYLSDDPWVIRRHAALLADAGIDTLIFDTTNAVTYQPVYRKLCEVFEQVRKEGGRTPQIAFMMNSNAGETAQAVYKDLYAPGLYRDLWFVWDGKPLMICDPEKASPELQKFFTLRRAHWPFKMKDTPYAWHWEAAYPQPFGYTDDPARPEQVNVSVAQNLSAEPHAHVTDMSTGKARGRGFHGGKSDSSPEALVRGLNFQEQWARARELDPPFVMVTGWNEWIAGRFQRPGEPVAFVDQFSREFSRDIEPMKGGHGDNYYYQLVANVRRYKGVAPLPQASGERSIAVDQGFAQWSDVRPEFIDNAGDTTSRDFDTAAGSHATDRSGRNDLVMAKAARDPAHVYFYLRTKDAIQPADTAEGLWLLIDADQRHETGWEGYDLMVRFDAQQKSWRLAKNTGGWKWEDAGAVAARVEGNELQLSIPRTAFSVAQARPFSFDFKWADNLQRPGDVMDFYLSGDVAPDARFNFRYTGE